MLMPTTLLLATLFAGALLRGQAPVPSPQEPAKPVGEQPADGKKPAPPSPGEPSRGDAKPVGQEPAQPKPDQPKPDQPTPAEPAPLPRSADPADLAAIRSAEAMIEAEKRLAEMIKEGKITGLDKIVTFDELSAWPYEDGLKGMPKSLKELHGKKVLMSGFMLPIDDVKNIKEFLLVQSLWSCCYGQPPDINGIVRVVMPAGKTTDYFFDPLKIVGTFKVEATVIDGYCVDIYQLDVETLEPLK